MNVVLPNFTAALPEILILCFACLALIADMLWGRLCKSIAFGVVQAGLLVTALTVVAQSGLPTQITFEGQYINDNLTRVFFFFITLGAFMAFMYSRRYVANREIPSTEYYILGLFSVLGMMVLVSAYSLLMIFLGLELLSLPLYAMVALARTNGTATEAAMKYFITGSIASGMMLYGMSIIYGATGSLSFSELSAAISTIPHGEWIMLQFGLVFLLAGIAFKLAAVPFHMWAPDVYTGAPTSVTLFVGSVPKLAALGMAMRLLVFAMPQLHLYWQQALIVMAVLSMGLGNLFAIAQTNLKRMFAYSAIAHVGYMFLGLITGSQEGYSASQFYMIAYMFMSLAAFGMLVVLSQQSNEVEQLLDVKGLNQRSPWLAFLMLVILFSLAGIPPTVGFFAKIFVIKALLAQQFYVLAVIAMLFALVGAFYYIRVVKVMYFDEPERGAAAIALPLDSRVLISVNAIGLLALGFFPGVILGLVR